MHITNVQTVFCVPNLYDDVSSVLLDFVSPFVERQRERFTHWHYLLEPEKCRGQFGEPTQVSFYEIRLRFEGDGENLTQIKNDLTQDLEVFSERTHLTMKVSEPLGSHEGCHGRRNTPYKGAESERDFGRDFPVMVEIWQKGSEFVIELFRQGRKLVEKYSLQYGSRGSTEHPRYLHYPANQLLLEP